MYIGIFSVVYPGAAPFLQDFLNSLAAQTDQGFVLFLINDGLAGLDKLLKAYSLPVKTKEASGPPAALRKIGIDWVTAAGVESIIFADADDYFVGNRVEISKNLLSTYDLVINELMLTGNGILEPFAMWGPRFKEGEAIKSEHVASGNCMGLTNTAVRANALPEHLEQIPDDIIAFDWALFSMCLRGGAQAVFTRKTHTYYRQHGNNTACIQPFSEEQVLRGVRVKADHYRFLSKYNGELAALAGNFAGLHNKLSSDAALLQEYCRAVRRLSPPSPLWWEPLKTLEELGL